MVVRSPGRPRSCPPGPVRDIPGGNALDVALVAEVHEVGEVVDLDPRATSPRS